MTEALWNSLGRLGHALVARLPYLGIALVVCFVFYVVGRMVRGVLRATARHTRLDNVLADLLGRLFTIGLTLLGALIGAVVVFPSFRPGDLLAGLGITSVAISFAFKDVLQNMLAGILILWRKPFQVGDQIQTREHEGTVEEINVRSTRLHTYDDTHVVVPNSDVYTNPVTVLTAYERRRTHLIVGIGYGDDIDEARDVIRRVLAATEGVAAEPAPLVYVHEFAPSTVNLAVYFWSGSRQAEVLAARHRAARGIKKALDVAHIDIAYPHTVVLLDRLPPLSLAIEERPGPHPSDAQ